MDKQLPPELAVGSDRCWKLQAVSLSPRCVKGRSGRKLQDSDVGLQFWSIAEHVDVRQDSTDCCLLGSCDGLRDTGSHFRFTHLEYASFGLNATCHTATDRFSKLRQVAYESKL